MKIKLLHASALLILITVFSLRVFPQRGWVAQPSGITKTLSDVYFADTLHGWAVGYNGTILRTSDGGEYWEISTLSPSSYFEGVWFTDTLHGWICGTMGSIYHTQDGGDTWTQQSAPLPGDFYKICFAGDSTGWIVGDNGVILGTVDAGENWIFQFSGVLQDLVAVSFTDVNNGWVAGGTESGVLLSTSNGGQTWVLRDPGTPDLLYAVFFINPYMGWLGLNNVILHTTDVGDHWLGQVPPGVDGPVNGLWFTTVNRGWAIQGPRVYATADGGVSWSLQLTALPFKYFTAICFADTAHGWVVGKDGIIYHTSDGGASGIDHHDVAAITVAPNPGTGLFYLTLSSALTPEDCKISVYDLQGHKIMTTAAEGHISIPLDLRHYPDGIYFLRTGNEKKQVVEKIIKLR